MRKEGCKKVDEKIEAVHNYWIDPDSREIWIHSVDVSDGCAIYDTIKLMPYPVTIISYTYARSMSSIILQAAAGECDTRLLMPSSYFMFHFGTIASEGHTKAVYSDVEFSKKYDELMLDVYVESLKKGKKFKGVSDSKIRKTLINQMDKKCDVFLTAEEAVEWGFADGILESWPDSSNWKV